MPLGVLSPRVDTWLYGRLTGDATLMALTPGGVAPDDVTPAATAPYPYVRYVNLAAVPTATLQGARIVGQLVYLVEVVGKTGSFLSLRAAADRVYELLHQQSGVSVNPADGLILKCVAEDESRRVVDESGVRFRFLGNRWRIWMQPA